MPIATKFKQGVVYVDLEGDLDMNIAAVFREKVDFALDSYGAKNMLLNFSKVTFVDSSGLGVILGRYKKIAMLGGKMAAVNVPSSVERILQISGLLKIMPIYATEQEALMRF